MADAQQYNEDDELRLPFFPPPPPFFQHFTSENQTRLKEIRKEAGIDTSNDNEIHPSLTAEQILALPTELRYLIPPEPPADDQEFKVFGDVAKAEGADSFSKTMDWISRSLASDFTIVDWQYEQLYPSTSSSQSSAASVDRQRYLFRFLRSILIAYIELLGIIAANPTSEQKDKKLKDILTMVTNMHALINEYRPHQARETLIREMERQVERKKKEIEGVKKMQARVQEVLDGFGKESVSGKGDIEDDAQKYDIVPEEDRKKGAQKQMWTAIDEILA